MHAIVSPSSFNELNQALRRMMKDAPQVKTERWQGISTKDKPALVSYELRNVCYEIGLGGCEDLSHYRADIKPNLPWADDHFVERVGGKVLNPGEEWKNWPWAGSAAKFTQPQESGPRIPSHDWAYLAGMIDGDGSIEPRAKSLPTFQGRISVGQKDRMVLDYLQGVFKVGTVYAMPLRDIMIRDKIHLHACHMWMIYGSANNRWIAEGCMPYLKVKLAKAEEMLRVLDIGDEKIGGPKSHRKTVWGQSWPARFNHSYADRLWPKKLEGGSVMRGISGREYGDLQDLVDLLAKEPYTRQAWIPLFHPEDTGIADGGRKLCSLGYQFLVRDGLLHLYYPMRSCDLIRHWADDCYLAVRLLLWVLHQCRKIGAKEWESIKPGSLAMHMTSCHVFHNDLKTL